MSRTISPSSTKPYSLVRVCRVWGIPRSTVYAQRERRNCRRVPAKRGPRTAWSDEKLLKEIRKDLAESPWTGEGHRKVWARLRARGIRTSKPRVLRIMREAQLLAPVRQGRPRGPQDHDGSITPELPDVMWGSDATSTLTLREGTATIFGVIDHGTAECLALNASKRGTRFEAIDSLRQAVTSRTGGYREGVLAELQLRHDHGSAFVSDLFQDELRFLGIESSPAFVRAPEGNGCIERFFRTLKEQLLWIKPFATIAELQIALDAFRKKYNEQWLLERHGYVSPSKARERLLAQGSAA